MNEKLIPIKHKNLSFDISCNYEQAGSVWVVCLHGLQSNKAAFSVVAELCAQKRFSFLSFDFVGFGNSEKPDDFSYDLKDQAVIAGKIIEQFQIESFFLVGHSMGGMVGTLLLERFEAKLLGFINMEGNFVLEDCGASLPASQMTFAEFSKTFFPDLKKSLETSREPSALSRKKWLQDTSDKAFYATSQSIVELSRAGQLIPGFVGSPVRKLFVFGDQNRRKSAVLPESILKSEISDAGHFMLADNPKQTLKVIEDFIDAG